MATYRAIEAATRAVVGLLSDSFDPTTFPLGDLDFAVIDGGDLAADTPTGAGVLVYRVGVNGSLRHPSGRTTPTGERHLPKLPVDVHVLVVISAKVASTKLALTGWIMRTLEDHPVLPSGLLNRGLGGVFEPDETVDLAFEDLSHEELLHLWEVLGAADADVVVLPYVLKDIQIESTLLESEGSAVQERLVRYGRVEALA